MEFGVYISQVDAFIENALSSLEVKFSNELGCNNPPQSIFSSLMINLTSNSIDIFLKIAAYAKKGIDIWEQVCEIKHPCTTKALLSNLCILFGLSKGFTQEYPSYLEKRRNVISLCKSGGEEFSMSLENIIAVQHFDPRRHVVDQQ